MPATTSVRPAAVAGLFYPADARALRVAVDEALRGARGAPGAAAPKLLVVPHAGYVYSGPVAGSAYAALSPWAAGIRRVVLIGPAHRVALRGLAVPAVDAFDTPLGRVPLDRTALADIATLPQVATSDTAHAHEHALEVQLPFLQVLLGPFTLLPLLVGEARPEAVAQVLERLWGGPETLIVVSSDLSHYLPAAEADALDAASVARLLAGDGALDPQEACGARALAGALPVARAHGLRPRLLDRRHSGDTAGDRARVVGYAALAFEPEAAAADEAALGAALLARARNSIAAALGAPTGPEPPHPALPSPGATFVTLRVGGALRACIGTLNATQPLEADVREHARAAAFDDHRFEPLRAEELGALRVEVSVLGASEPLPAASAAQAQAQLRPGRDGLTLRWRGHCATFLPQVWAQLPAPADFLAALRRKAGLAEDFWADDLRLERYAVRQFGEERAP